MRTLIRHRSELVQPASQHIQHMHKALTQMNVQIHHVINDLTSVTGLAILDAILEGQRDPAILAKFRDPRIKATEETIRKSLVGNWRREHLFTLKQSRELYRTYQQRIVACDQEIESLLKLLIVGGRNTGIGKLRDESRTRNSSRYTCRYAIAAHRTTSRTDPQFPEQAVASVKLVDDADTVPVPAL